MLFSKATIISALIAAASALSITAPANGANVNLANNFTVSWTSVNTDPANFQIVLVNNAARNPPVSIVIASSVATSSNSYVVRGGSVNAATAGTGAGFQINLLSTTNSGILAQSQQFNISSGAAAVSSAVSSSRASSSATASSSARPSSSAAAVASSSARASSAASSSRAASSSAAAAAAGAVGASSSRASTPTPVGTPSRTPTPSSSLVLATKNAAPIATAGVAALGMVGAFAALLA